jgi:hypothetical protein
VVVAEAGAVALEVPAVWMNPAVPVAVEEQADQGRQ